MKKHIQMIIRILVGGGVLIVSYDAIKRARGDIAFIIILVYVLLAFGPIIFAKFYNKLNEISFNPQTHNKNCSSCGKPVSSKAEVGQTCPHCGVVWSFENRT